jgi:hypothetical protein
VPGYRLTPFGAQYTLENLLSLEGDDRMGPGPVILRGAYGDGELGRSMGLDIEAREFLRRGRYCMDAALHAWRQPGLMLDPDDASSGKAGHWGFGGEIGVSMPTPIPFLRLSVAGGWKGDGYLPGWTLDAGPVLRLGVGLELASEG